MQSVERRAHNEELFRAVNEKISELNAAFEEFTGNASAFVCECDDITCDAQVRMSTDDYRRIRRNPDLFIVKPGHQAPSALERVVEKGGEYLVVAKTEAAKRSLHEGDPNRYSG